MTVVDVKAQDEQGKVFQIEMQVTSPDFLTKRILYTWASVYGKQIQSSEPYAQLEPVISIWVLTNSLFKNVGEHHLHFQAWDLKNELKLTDQMSIHIFELDKWHKPYTLQGEDFWLYFLKYGGEFESLPNELTQCNEVIDAMTVLKEIAESEEDYHLYESRMESLRYQRSIELERQQNKQKLKETLNRLDTAEDELDSTKGERDSAIGELEKAQNKIKQLEALLQSK